MSTILQQIGRAQAELRTKPRRPRRVELEKRLRLLIVSQVRAEIRQDRKRRR